MYFVLLSIFFLCAFSVRGAACLACAACRFAGGGAPNPFFVRACVRIASTFAGRRGSPVFSPT